ncbi:MAG: EamA family transporter [Candidatus Sungbacteria bacterium]|nr:EamA family transporter [Candidatus Sungbacteria bacterium]
MNWLYLALGAQFIFGSAGVFDRILLKQKDFSPWPYAFWFGILGFSSILVLPFGFQVPTLIAVALAIPAGVCFIVSAFFFYESLEHSEASEAMPLVGVLSPVFTFVLTSIFLQSRIGLAEGVGFIFLIIGGIILFVSEKRRGRRRLFFYTHAAALAGAISLVLTKAVFAQTSFATGFFLVRTAAAIFALSLLFLPRLRNEIKRSELRATRHEKILYFANRGYAAVGSLMFAGAVSLANPALVDATSNVQYIILFFLAWALAHERFRGKILVGKLAAAALIAIGLGWLSLGAYASSLPPVNPARPIVWGVTFSQKFSEELGLDWRENFRAVFDELHPARLRLMAYWNEIEPEEGEFSFDDLDWQIEEARSRGTPVVLAIGMKLPRWPECHIPEWANALLPEEREIALRPYLAAVIEHYRDKKTIFMWQVENEPYLSFGECVSRPDGSIPEEVKMVQGMDASRRVMVTDSGEVGEWIRAARLGDVFGTSMYRKIYPRFGGRLTGTIEYPISPEFFRVKERFVRWFINEPEKRFIVHELQAEPWEPESLGKVPLDEQMRVFSPEYFSDTIDFAKRTGFDEYYLWGAEWWYWMKTKQSVSDYWNIAKALME